MLTRKSIRRRSKYGSHKTYFNGHLYDSKLEADFAKHLDILRKAVNPCDRVVKIERQKKYHILPSPWTIIYSLDFKVQYADGSHRYFEVKGFQTKESKLKHKLMEYFYPGIKIEFIKTIPG